MLIDKVVVFIYIYRNYFFLYYLSLIKKKLALEPLKYNLIQDIQTVKLNVVVLGIICLVPCSSHPRRILNTASIRLFGQQG